MRSYLGLIMIMLAVTASRAQQTFVSELNGKDLTVEKVKYPYKVLFGGHLYGSQDETKPPYGTFSKAANIINLEKPVAFFSLGDAVRKADMQKLDSLSDLMQRIDAPVFGVMGNHEWADSIKAQMYLGFPYYLVESPATVFIVLNSEDWNDAEQTRFWKKQLAASIKNKQVKNIFILTHRLVWAIGNPAFAELIGFTNSPAMHEGIPPVDIAELKGHTEKNFYFISGDLGVNPNLPFFMQTDGNITYIATGLGDNANDALIEATFEQGKPVSFSAVYLGSDTKAQLSEYNSTKVSQLLRKNETLKAVTELKQAGVSKGLILGLLTLVIVLGLWLLLGKNEI